MRILFAALIAIPLAGCATSNAVPRPFPGVPAPARVDGTPAITYPAPLAPDARSARLGIDAPASPLSLTAHRYDGRAVAEFALAFRGVPYRFGGADPAGFDCSGIVRSVFARYGVDVPRVVEDQWEVGDKVKRGAIKPGDLLFFSTKSPGASHVGIALDDQRFVHAPNSTGVVRIEALDSSYWRPRFIGARRINGPGRS